MQVDMLLFTKGDGAVRQFSFFCVHQFKKKKKSLRKRSASKLQRSLQEFRSKQAFDGSLACRVAVLEHVTSCGC